MKKLPHWQRQKYKTTNQSLECKLKMVLMMVMITMINIMMMIFIVMNNNMGGGSALGICEENMLAKVEYEI